VLHACAPGLERNERSPKTWSGPRPTGATASASPGPRLLNEDLAWGETSGLTGRGFGAGLGVAVVVAGAVVVASPAPVGCDTAIVAGCDAPSPSRKSAAPAAPAPNAKRNVSTTGNAVRMAGVIVTQFSSVSQSCCAVGHGGGYDTRRHGKDAAN
jgi:hypothetical protein